MPFVLTYCSAFCCFVSWLCIKRAVKILCLTWEHTTHTHSHRWFKRADMSQSSEQLLSGVYLGHVCACGETVADSPPMQGTDFPLPPTVPLLWPLQTCYQPGKNTITAFFSNIKRMWKCMATSQSSTKFSWKLAETKMPFIEKSTTGTNKWIKNWTPRLPLGM